MIRALTGMYEEVRFLHGVYEFNDLYPAFDLLTGSSLIREMILKGSTLDEMATTWSGDEKEFIEKKEAFHLYR